MREWEKHREYETAVYAELNASLRNVALGKGFKPPSGEVWTADMLMPGYRTTAAPKDWKADQQSLMGNAKKLSQQAAAMSPEGRARAKAMREGLKTTGARRKRAAEMKREGADPARVKQFLLTGK